MMIPFANSGPDVNDVDLPSGSLSLWSSCRLDMSPGLHFWSTRGALFPEFESDEALLARRLLRLAYASSVAKALNTCSSVDQLHEYSLIGYFILRSCRRLYMKPKVLSFFRSLRWTQTPSSWATVASEAFQDNSAQIRPTQFWRMASLCNDCMSTFWPSRSLCRNVKKRPALDSSSLK